MSSQDKDAQPEKDTAAELGRQAGRLFKTAKPRAKKLLEEGRPRLEQAGKEAQKAFEKNRPKLEQAGKEAWRYAREHEDEIRGVAMKGVRMRLGPLGYVVDALGPQPAEQPQDESRCPSCRAESVRSAQFCSQCGTKLPSQRGARGQQARGGNQ